MGDILGFWGTLFAVFITAWLGAKLVKKQGMDVLLSAENAIRQGKTPLKEVYAGICLLLAGALLVTPGFLTDGVGILLLMPWFRDILGIHLVTKIMQNPNFKVHASFKQNRDNGLYDDDIIDGDFTKHTPENKEHPNQKHLNKPN